MRNALLLVTLVLLPLAAAFAQDAPKAYVLYTGEGKPTKYKKLLKACEQADFIFFGEQHNNPIAHWLTYELYDDLQPQSEADKPTDLAMEMLELHQQAAMDAYISHSIDADSLQALTSMWPNFKTDYLPVINRVYNQAYFTKLIASNITRKYASLVFRHGIDSLRNLTITDLPPDALPPLDFPIPYESRSYQEMMEMMGGHGHGSNGDMQKRFVQAQAIKDATMAYSIYRAFDNTQRIFHLNGNFHSQYAEGTVYYLKYWLQQSNQFGEDFEPKIVTISQEEVTNPNAFNTDFEGKSDFIIQVPATMTKTY